MRDNETYKNICINGSANEKWEDTSTAIVTKASIMGSVCNFHKKYYKMRVADIYDLIGLASRAKKKRLKQKKINQAILSTRKLLEEIEHDIDFTEDIK